MCPDQTPQLLQLIGQNSEPAFRELVKLHWEKLYIYAHKMTGDRELSQSIVQNLFIDLWEKRRELSIQNPQNYFFKAVKFQVFKHYRDHKMDRLVLQDQFEDYLPAPELESTEELEIRLHQSIDRLPKRCQEIFRLNRFSELSIDQIAEQLALSRQTVKNQLNKAFQFLKADLGKN